MPWRYGIVKYHPKDRTYDVYGIGELYYDTDPLQPFACTEEPVEPYADADDDEPAAAIAEQLQMMLNDIKKYPVFDVDGPYAPNPYGGEDEAR
jgi:hypothetical protein